MRGHYVRRLLGLLVTLLLVVSACGGDDQAGESVGNGDEATDGDETEDAAAEDGDCETLDEVSLQLKWVAQAQFAGYYAAADRGYYAGQCLNVTIQEGGPDVGPAQVVAGGGADFGIDWLAATLAQRAAGEDFINVAQVYERSGLLQVAWADSGITSFEDLEGTRVGAWGFGNEYELFAALQQAGLDPQADVELVDQPFDMTLLLNRDIESAQAITYNEYAQLLETTDPETDELYQPDDFVVLDMNEAGVNMLHDGIFASQAYVEANEDVTTRFLRSSFEGWIHCREDPEDCVQVVFDRGSVLGQGHQRWMMNEVNRLIWPSTNGIGWMDEEDFTRTAEIAQTYIEGIEEMPTPDAYTTTYVEQAWEGIEGDIDGADWEAEDVEVTPGGE